MLLVILFDLNILGNSSLPSFYHPTKNPLGQIFNIGEIVDLAGGNYTSLAINGGVIGIRWVTMLKINVVSGLMKLIL